MWLWIKDFLYDRTVFVAVIRGLISFLGVAVATGAIPTGGEDWKWGLWIMAASHFLPAGQANRPIQEAKP